MFQEQENLDELVASTARLLLRKDHMKESYFVTHSRASAQTDDRDYDFWLIWFHLPVDVYGGITSRESVEKTIDQAVDEVISSMTTGISAKVSLKIDTKIDYHKDWRREMARILSGETISNQGRVRSDNIATIQEDGLLFRSEPEVKFYRAAKARDLPFAPLPVFIKGGRTYRRAEPDFVVIKGGVTLIVELDGRLVHRESPVEAQERLAFLESQGVQIHRIPANNCMTDEDAEKCVNGVLSKIEQIKNLRR